MCPCRCASAFSVCVWERYCAKSVCVHSYPNLCVYVCVCVCVCVSAWILVHTGFNDNYYSFRPLGEINLFTHIRVF